MNVSVEEKKAEAIARMKMLGIFPETIRQFEREGYISLSEPPFGAFYWVEGDDLERVREHEKENDVLVYIGVRCYTSIGMMDSYLYVSDYREDWEAERQDIQNGEVVAWTYNHSMPEWPETGFIGIAKTPAAGLCRTY